MILDIYFRHKEMISFTLFNLDYVLGFVVDFSCLISSVSKKNQRCVKYFLKLRIISYYAFVIRNDSYIFVMSIINMFHE